MNSYAYKAKLKTLHDLRDSQWDKLMALEKINQTNKSLDVACNLDMARTRWANTNRIIRFLEDEITAGEL